MKELNKYWKEKEKLINRALSSYLGNGNYINRDLLKWMRYTTLAKGKRIRGLLVLATVEGWNKDPRKFLPIACGIEMIHASSLILDDLPCIDDALLRRGKPALHRVAGEAGAILSAYALCAKGMELVVENIYNLHASTYDFYRILLSISRAVGLGGISLGEFLDLKYSEIVYSRKDIDKVHFYKTASLFIATLEVVGIILRLTKKELQALKNYGKNLGLAFQIRDDFLEKIMKKDDKYSLKEGLRPNYFTLVGEEKTRKTFLKYKNKAIESLKIFGKKAKRLREVISLLKI